ncbi:metal ABC transporter ATP-binding protein [Candidatus Chlorohelix sp.]|uniref:metal ABC transporter ATP-binding protein n=1 Tax=Candidatus Chlorohelix sp. TaxID=3139201 RepID=UPI0030241021
MSDKLPKNLSNFPDLSSISLGQDCGPECHEEGHNPLLEIKDLSVSYGQNTVLSEVSFELGSGQLVGIIGPNGAGKSTLIKSILGLTPYRGRVMVNGLPAKQARLKLAYVPQKEEVRWDYPVTVEDVVMMGRYRRIGWVRGPRKDDHVVVEEALELVDMLPLKQRQISQLSGGQQQRVFVARALAQQGEIILLDEPLTGVDTTSQEVIINIIKHQRKHGKLILMATHDLNAAARECDNIACINRGLVALGTSRQVFTPEILARTYGGRAVSLQGESSTFILD